MSVNRKYHQQNALVMKEQKSMWETKIKVHTLIGCKTRKMMAF